MTNAEANAKLARFYSEAERAFHPAYAAGEQPAANAPSYDSPYATANDDE